MDPNKALEDIRDIIGQMDDATSGMMEGLGDALANAFEALDDWLSMGGFPPEQWKTSPSDEECYE